MAWASDLQRISYSPHSSQMPCCLRILCRLSFFVSSFILIVSAIISKRPGSILRTSFDVRNPMSFPFSTTGSLLIFFFLNFRIASVISAPGFIVTIFRFIRSFALIFFRSCLDFLTTAQTMSFSVRIPLSFSPSLIIRLPTLFLTIVLAHFFRSVSGLTWMKFRVIRSPTFIPVSMVIKGENCLYRFRSIFG